MADLIRLANLDVVIQKDKLSTHILPDLNDDNLNNLLPINMNNFGGMMATGGFDLNDLAQELDQDEFDAINIMNGKLIS